MATEYLTNDIELTSVADAIRAKGGTSAPLAYPSGFVSAIQAIKSAPTGPYMVGECSSLTSITIPASVTTIGDEAFANDAGMTTITCLAETPPTIGANAFTVGAGTTIKVPAASVAAYKAATNWSSYADYIVGV